MKITNRTLVGEVATILNGEHLEKLLEQCPAVELEKPLIGMTVGEFLECLGEDYPYTFFQDNKQRLTVAIGRFKQFKKELEDIQKVLKLNEISTTPEEQAAQNGVVWPTFQEGVLCDCVDWFNLHSLEDAEKLPLTNYLIMKRKKNAESLFERNLNKIYNEKAKRKK